MTGLKLTRTPAMQAALARIKASIAAGKTPSASAPPKRKFLPGERRSNVGADGFQELNPRLRAAAYRRELYSTAEERNLTPPRRAARINVGDDSSSPWELDCAQRTGLFHLCRQVHAGEYIQHLHENLHCASYRKWHVGPWTWDQATAQTSSQVLPLPLP